MQRCACDWCNHESEVATAWRNAIGSVPQLWQPAEHIDDGRRARCSRAPCRRFPLERHACLMGEECHVARQAGKMPANGLGWSLASGRGGLSELLNDEQPAQRGLAEAPRNYPPSPIAAPTIHMFAN